jgi:hypothetical protein
VGAPPPGNGNSTVWAASVKENPVPLDIKLKSITSILQPEYLGEDLAWMFITQFEQTALDYCKHLKEMGEIPENFTCD